MSDMQILNAQLGDPRYQELFDQLREPGLAAEMWADAEHDLPQEDPNTVWTFAVVDGAIAAWAAATVITSTEPEPVLLCTDHYERRGPGRDRGLFKQVLKHVFVAGGPESEHDEHPDTAVVAELLACGVDSDRLSRTPDGVHRLALDGGWVAFGHEPASNGEPYWTATCHSDDGEEETMVFDGHDVRQLADTLAKLSPPAWVP